LTDPHCTIGDVRRRRSGVLAIVAGALSLTLATSACSGGPGRTAQRAPTRSDAGRPAEVVGVETGTAPTTTFGVGSRTFTFVRSSDRVIKTTVWYPAKARGGAGAAVASGRFPVVVFSHGLTAVPTDYRDLVTRWAAAGFIVVGPAYPHTSRGVKRFEVLDVVNQPADASFALSQVLALDRSSTDVLRGHLNADRLAAAGHSAGAITTVGLFANGRDERLDAGIVLAGNGLGMGSTYVGAPAALLFVHGDQDPITPYSLGVGAFDAAPATWPKAFLTLSGQGHIDPYLRRDRPAFRAVAAITTDFLRWTLYGDPAAKARLAGDAKGAGSLDSRF
jgi:fermentation-respiration switch protein FrsA (DUF1100 family)